MALTVTNRISNAARTWKIEGLVFCQVEVTVGATADYSGGYDLNTIRAKMGFRTLFGVLFESVRIAAGTLRGQVGIYDSNTGKLRLFLTGTGTAPNEAVAGTDNAIGDKVRIWVYGV